MQHQQDMHQQAANGAAQLNGNVDSAVAVNGVAEIKKPSIKLDDIDKDMVRLIGQHLTNLGFKDTVEHLMRESGCRLDHPEASRFRECVLLGDWQGADSALNHLQDKLDSLGHLTEMRFLILEQKYMELIERRDDIGALACLREEISPLAQAHNVDRVHKLSNLMFLNPHTELKRATNWLGSGQDSRHSLMNKLTTYLPASIMMPPRRLEDLIIQALKQQIAECEYHNTTIGPLSAEGVFSGRIIDVANSGQDFVGDNCCLLTNHQCSKDSFPTTCLHTINEHSDEVLIARFSPNGRLLATAGKDLTLIIWDVDLVTMKLTRRHFLDDHSFSIVFLSWSHDSTKVIACMQEDSAELIVWDAERGKQVCKVADSTNDSLTCACWYKDNERFVCGGLRGQFYLCNLEGTVVERWEGVRVQAIAIDADGRTVLASDTHRRIRAYQLEDSHDYSILQEDHGIMSFSLDQSGRYALMNVNNQGVHMWDLKDRTLVRKFRGAIQGHCTIHSCFGGLNQDFVASGSEDHKVYVWHRNRELPVVVLSGHQRTVNCVTWNPVRPSMLVSVSDDHTIRIWGPAPSSSLGGFHRSTGSAVAEGEVAASSNGQLPHTLMSSLDISGH